MNLLKEKVKFINLKENATERESKQKQWYLEILNKCDSLQNKSKDALQKNILEKIFELNILMPSEKEKPCNEITELFKIECNLIDTLDSLENNNELKKYQAGCNEINFIRKIGKIGKRINSFF